jgi:prepilin-type N-terminal cleavage/methylation domain-containing protein
MRGPRRSPRGFTLVEFLIASFLLLVIMLVMGMLFDRSSRITKIESNVTDEQQNVRYASYQMTREVRMTGAAGLLPSSTIGGIRQLGVSLNLGSSTFGTGATFRNNNMAADVMIGGTHHIRMGTDMLHIRGVISNALYDLGAPAFAPGSSAALTITPCSRYRDPSAQVGAPCYPFALNDMSAFQTPGSVTNRLFVLSDTFGNLGVGVVKTATAAGTFTLLTAALTIDTTSSGGGAYPLSLNPGSVFPPGLTNPSRGGILDDRVYFIDDGTVSPAPKCAAGNGMQSPGPCHPVLSVADWAPNDSTGSPFSTATVTPIADDIEDMQVAYGLDFFNVVTNTGSYATPAPTSDGSISILNQATFNSIVSGSTLDVDSAENASGPNLDEWVGNATNEIAAYGDFTETKDLSRLRSVEISLLAKGTEPDTKLRGAFGSMAYPIMDTAAKTVSDSTVGNGLPYHRRVQTVRINLRNFQSQ